MRGAWGTEVSEWILIPASSRSKSIPGKHLRPLGGRPLLDYVLDTATGFVGAERTIVSTDEPLVAQLAAGRARIVQRPERLRKYDVTMDEVAVHAAEVLLADGAAPDDIFLTMQPTSPFVSPRSIRQALEALADGGSLISVMDDRGLRWTRDEAGQPVALFTQRVGREWLPPNFIETGGLIGARFGDIVSQGTRIVDPVHLLELDEREGLEIRTFGGWAVAEYLYRRRRVMIRADASMTMGMGHVFRALALADELAEHDIEIVTRTDGNWSLGAEFLAEQFSRTVGVSSENEFLELLAERRPDLCILDVLDTEQAFVEAVRESCDVVISIEDLGPGANLCDLVINDIYTDPYPHENHWYGVEFAILASQFERARPTPELRSEVESILVTFGGADPCHLTERALEALSLLEFRGEVTVVLGPGFRHPEPNLAGLGLRGAVLRSAPNMAELMGAADLAITSAGRTVTELMVLGVPTITMCQNERELLHTHASSPFGVTNLGLGEHITSEQLAHHVRVLSGDLGLRRAMRERMLKAVRGRSNQAVADKIMQAAEDVRRAK